MRTTVLTVSTGHREAVIDLTGRCAAFLGEQAADEDGLLNIWVPHATAGVAVLETGAGSDDDLLTALRFLLPPQPSGESWRHRHGSPGHGRDHVLPAFIAPSAMVPVIGGELALGTWQSIVLVDTNVDNPTRQVRLSLLAG